MKAHRSSSKAVSNVFAYMFSFTIVSIVMMSTIYASTTIISNKQSEGAVLQAENLANKIVDALVEVKTVADTMPDAEYSKKIDIPTNLAGKSYYIDIVGSTVSVKTTDGSVSKSATCYSTQDITSGRIYGDSGELSVSYQPSSAVYNLDFGGGNSTSYTPVETGYYRVDPNATDPTNGQPKWDPSWPQDLVGYPYRMLITIKNYKGYNDNNKTSIKLQLTPSNFDYRHAQVNITDTGMIDKTNFTFVMQDPVAGSYNPLLFFIDQWNPNGTSIVYLDVMKSGYHDTLYVFCYYGASELSPIDNTENTWNFYADFLKTTINSTATLPSWMNPTAAFLDSNGGLYVGGDALNYFNVTSCDCSNVLGSANCQICGSQHDWITKKFTPLLYEDKTWNMTWTTQYRWWVEVGWICDEWVEGHEEDPEYCTHEYPVYGEWKYNWSYDYIAAMVTDSNGSVYVVGNDGPDGETPLARIIKKYDINGQQIVTGWPKKNPTYDFNNIAIDKKTNDVYVYGNAGLYKFASSGFNQTGGLGTLWKRTDRHGAGMALYTDDTDTYIYVGSWWDKNWSIRQYNSSGGEIWTKVIPMNYGIYISSLQCLDVDDDGNVYAGGASYYGYFKDIRSFDRDGNPRWSVHSTSGRFLFNLRYDPAGYIYAAGTISSGMWVAKYDASTGAEVIGNPANGLNWPLHSIAGSANFVFVDSSHNVYVFGPYNNSYIHKYNASGWPCDLNFSEYILTIWVPSLYETFSIDNINGILSLNSKIAAGSPGYFITRDPVIPEVQVPELSVGETQKSNDAVYVVEMKFKIHQGQGSMILLNQGDAQNDTYNASYSVTIDSSSDPPTMRILKHIGQHDYISTHSTLLPSIADKWLLMKSFIYLNATNHSSYNWNATYINSYLYDADTLAPLGTNISAYDITCNQTGVLPPIIYNGDYLNGVGSFPYLSGGIGMGVGLQAIDDPNNMSIDWIRSSRQLPVEPTIIYGAWESNRFIWNVNPDEIKSVSNNGLTPFIPGPIFSNSISGSSMVPSGSSSFLIKNVPSGKTRITVTKGDTSIALKSMTITYVVESSSSSFQVPETRAGEFKSSSVVVDLTGSSNDVYLYFASDDASEHWRINAISVEEGYKGIAVEPR